MRLYRRFDAFDRGLHVALMVSFLGLAVSGLPLLFSESVWASWLAHALGGFHAAGIVHRTAAVVLIGVFLAHLGRVGKRLVINRDLGVLWGPRSMTPQPRDVRDLFNHMKWFLGMGPRPRFDRYTYWEKFDYMAVFWGMGIIGGSGLMLWFPTLFAHIVPGWVFNVATLIHGEEALLAVGFIFTVHFFNTHFRPEKFPMDTVIFTGGIPLEEFKTDRPREYEALLQSGKLEERLIPAPDPRDLRRWKVIGGIALGLGIALVLLILYAAIFGYR